MSQHSLAHGGNEDEFDDEKMKYPKCQTCGQSIEGMPYDCWCDTPSNNDVYFNVPALVEEDEDRKDWGNSERPLILIQSPK